MHLGDCLGGYDFYDEKHEELLDEPRFRDNGAVTSETVANVNARILEINSKSGLYPLYITYSIFKKRCALEKADNLTRERQQELWRQTVEENIFVICKTPMARAITKRTLLGYKNGKINAHAFDDLLMQIKDKPEQFIDKIKRGSFWNKEVATMNFDAVVGNPPYQIMDGGAKASATPIYNFFVSVAKKCKPHFLSMIMPARWYAGGKGLDDFRNEMIHDSHMQFLFDYANSTDCFTGVNIAGGLCYFLWNVHYDGDCAITNRGRLSKESTAHRKLNEFEIVLRNNTAVGIINKIRQIENANLTNMVYTRNPFNLSSVERGKSERDATHNILMLSSNGKSYISDKRISDKKNIFDKYKSVVTYAMSGGNKPSSNGNYQVLSSLQILLPTEVCTETFLVLGAFDNLLESSNLCKYAKTKLFRFNLLQALTSIHITKDSFMFVPMQDFTGNSDIDWSKSIPEIDAQLYAKYNLDATEISFIESMIKPME